MKVNTDGVLLGAWAEASGAKTILDIGTGTGVIALMLAQKNCKAIIDAIDLDEDAYVQAKKNFAQSKWGNRLSAIHSSLQNYLPALTVSSHRAAVSHNFVRDGGGYDIIISNPPYFVDDSKTDNHQKNIAKHSTALSYEELLKGISHLLSAEGTAFLVVPVFNLKLIESLAGEEKLFIKRVAEVIAVKGKNSYLALIELSKTVASNESTKIVIQDEDGNFTDQYKELTKEFYLKF